MSIILNYDEAEEAIRNYMRDVRKEELPDGAVIEFDGTEVIIEIPIICEPIPLLKVIRDAAKIFKE